MCTTEKMDLRPEANALLSYADEPLPVLVTASHVKNYEGEIEESLEIGEIDELPDLKLEDTLLQRRHSLEQIHRLVSDRCHVSQDFVDKVIAFHLGHLILTVEDITSYFSFLDKSLHLFAHYCKDFTDLTAGDQHALLLDNAPIYFQLHLIRYIHAGNGNDQVKSLLGYSLPSDLLDCDKFLTVSFRYMAAASRLFKDPFWLEEFTTKADTLKAFDLNIDAISACILFHCDLEGKMKNYDEPDKIKHLYSNLLSEMCIKQGVGAEQLNGIIHRIRSLGHTFCHGSTVSLASYSYRETTKVSLSVIPAPCFENEEELFWMERQLGLCAEQSHKPFLDNNVKSDDLKSEEFVIDCIHQKCLIYLNCHHEYRQLSKEQKHFTHIYNAIQANISKAKAFILAYLEQCNDAQEQISWLFGSSSGKVQVTKISFTKYQNRHVTAMKHWLHRFPFMASCINTTLLVILWSTDLITEDSISLESHLAALRDRYEAYLVHTLKSQPDAEKCISLLSELLNPQ